MSNIDISLLDNGDVLVVTTTRSGGISITVTASMQLIDFCRLASPIIIQASPDYHDGITDVLPPDSYVGTE